MNTWRIISDSNTEDTRSPTVLMAISMISITDYSWVISAATVGIITVAFLLWKGKATQRPLSASSNATNQFLQLMKISLDTSAEVVRSFVHIRLLQPHGGCFISFLNKHKHDIYHYWEPKLLCCECPPHGCTLTRSKAVPNSLWEKLFTRTSCPKGSHLKMKRGKIVENCLHLFDIPSSISLQDLDITDMAFFLKQFGSLSTQEITALHTIISNRNTLCHAPKTDIYTSTELDQMVQTLRNAILILAQPSYRNIIKEQISLIQKVFFDDKDMQILHEKTIEIKQLLDETKHYIEDQCCTATRLDALETSLSLKTEEGSKELANAIKREVSNSTADIIQYIKKSDDTVALHFGMLEERIQNLEVKVNTCACSKVQNRDENELTSACRKDFIETVFKIPTGMLDEGFVLKEVNRINQENTLFKITSAERSCILLYIQSSVLIFRDEHTLRTAIRSLLNSIVKAGRIETQIYNKIEMSLTFQDPLSIDQIKVLNNMILEPTFGSMEDLPSSPQEQSRGQSMDSDESEYSDDELDETTPNINDMWRILNTQPITENGFRHVKDASVQVDLPAPYMIQIFSENKILKEELKKKTTEIKQLKKELKTFQRKRHKREKRKKSESGPKHTRTGSTRSTIKYCSSLPSLNETSGYLSSRIIVSDSGAVQVKTSESESVFSIDSPTSDRDMRHDFVFAIDYTDTDTDLDKLTRTESPESFNWI